jgi:hypothetical protein
VLTLTCELQVPGVPRAVGHFQCIQFGVRAAASPNLGVDGCCGPPAGGSSGVASSMVGDIPDLTASVVAPSAEVTQEEAVQAGPPTDSLEPTSSAPTAQVTQEEAAQGGPPTDPLAPTSSAPTSSDYCDEEWICVLCDGDGSLSQNLMQKPSKKAGKKKIKRGNSLISDSCTDSIEEVAPTQVISSPLCLLSRQPVCHLCPVCPLSHLCLLSHLFLIYLCTPCHLHPL